MKVDINSNGRPAVRLLAIDDEAQNLGLIEAALEQRGLEILSTSDPEKGLTIFCNEHPHIVLLDLKMPKMNGIELLEKMVVHDPGAEIILMTAHYTTESAVEAIHKGAADYLTKPLNIDKLRQRVDTYLKESQCRARAMELDQELATIFQLETIVGRSPAMLDVFSTVRRVSPHFRTALLTGATGTGKECIARALHRLSPAREKTFATCNCSALTETLYESELFGYVRGAFTGADQDKVGLFEYAQGGTVFLDEIGDMPLAGQAKLLRVLQNHEVQRVGSPAVRQVDVRVIAATNKDLRTLIAEKKFREDLFYRLSMVEITLPPLSDRKEDLALLQRHFLEKFAGQFNKNIRGLTRRAQQVLTRHSWPGNVRELENVIANSCMMADSGVIDIGDLPGYLRTSIKDASNAGGDVLSIDEVQRRHIVNVVQRLGGNKARAAEMLGISRTTLYSILNKLN